MNRTRAWMIAFAFATGLAGSGACAQDGPILVASANSTPRFMPLAGARSGNAGVRVIAPLRSDALAMKNGFMRLDRARLDTVRAQRPVSSSRVVSVTKEQGVNVVRPQDAAVLDLFGESEAQAPTVAGNGKRVAGHAWPLPVNAPQKFTSGYGVRSDPFHGKAGFHNGVDLSAPTGTPVFATADGVVSEVGSGARLGTYVRITHRDGTESTYGHMSRQQVRQGQRVRQHQQIGAVGSTGRSTGPHLHYAMKRGGKPMDPMLALRAPAGTGIRVASSTSMGVKVTR